VYSCAVPPVFVGTCDSLEDETKEPRVEDWTEGMRKRKRRRNGSFKRERKENIEEKERKRSVEKEKEEVMSMNAHSFLVLRSLVPNS
jgi:hypothetical protein